MGEFYFGVLEGISMIVVLFQFLVALFNNHLTTRKLTVMIGLTSGRLCFAGILLLPLIYPLSWSREIFYVLIILFLGLSTLLQPFGAPI